MAARESKRTSKTKPTDAANVLAFPPLPRIPSPPLLPRDPRQRRASQILGTIASISQTNMEVAGPNLVRGFHAAAVDLGRLQDALRRGVRRFDDAQLESRWPDVLACGRGRRGGSPRLSGSSSLSGRGASCLRPCRRRLVRRPLQPLVLGEDRRLNRHDRAVHGRNVKHDVERAPGARGRVRPGVDAFRLRVPGHVEDLDVPIPPGLVAALLVNGDALTGSASYFSGNPAARTLRP